MAPSAREKKSLVSLTKEFVGLLNTSPRREIDLDKAATHLTARKRRIYDITNVLEGIGLLQKTSKGVTRWVDCHRDHPMAHQSDESSRDLDTLRKTYQLLEEGVNDLQTKMRQQLNAEGAYVTYHDIKSIFNDQIAIAVKGPPGTRLEVNDQLQILVKSENGEIEAYLCPQFPNTTTTTTTTTNNNNSNNTNTQPQPCVGPTTNPQPSYPGLMSSDEGRGRSVSTYYDSTSGVNDDYYNDPTLSSALSSDDEDPSKPLVLYEADMEPHYDFMLDENYTITSLYTEDNLGLY